MGGREGEGEREGRAAKRRNKGGEERRGGGYGSEGVRSGSDMALTLRSS